MADLVDAFVGVRLNVSKLDKKGRKEVVYFFVCCPVLNKNTACRA